MNVPSCQRLSLWRTNSLVCSAFQRNTAASSDHQAFQLSGKKESSWVYFEKNSSAEGSSTWPVWKTTSETEFSPSVALISSLTVCSESLHFNITIHKKSKIKTKKWSPHTPKSRDRQECPVQDGNCFVHLWIVEMFIFWTVYRVYFYSAKSELQ